VGTIAPNDTWSKDYKIDLVPVPAGPMHLEHAWCVVNWAHLTDNAKRKWRVRPHQGSAVKRLHWFSRGKSHWRVALSDIPADIFYVTDSDVMHADDD
jgi:hypothetical protein